MGEHSASDPEHLNEAARRDSDIWKAATQGVIAPDDVDKVRAIAGTKRSWLERNPPFMLSAVIVVVVAAQAIRYGGPVRWFAAVILAIYAGIALTYMQARRQLARVEATLAAGGRRVHETDTPSDPEPRAGK